LKVFGPNYDWRKQRGNGFFADRSKSLASLPKISAAWFWSPHAMRVAFSYARLFIASCLFMGGVALQFVPSAAAMERNGRWRERQLQTIPADQRAKWIEERDAEDANSQAYLRLFGVLLGGCGFAAALREAAYINARYSR
jgi:hypothetical protein